MIKTSRRGFLRGGAGGMAAMGLTSAWPGGMRAFAKERLVVVEWGGAFIESMKKVAATQELYDIQWELHAGGAAAILPKIKAAWPKPNYDLVAAWDPVYVSMIGEDWLETVTPENTPNIVNVPESLIYKDKDGNFKCIPRSVSHSYWAYREDICPIEVTSLEDLLNPKLKGQVIFPHPIINTNMQTMLLALARGGDEHNMEPGWEFLKELAKSGNIGRVVSTNAETINALTSGEGSVSYTISSDWGAVAKSFPVRHLTKQDGMRTVISQEGWVILKGGNTKAAFDFANFTISPENNELFNAALGETPANQKSQVAPSLKHLHFTAEEFAKYTYTPDYPYVSAQADTWVKRWEQEIAPLL